MRLKKLKNRNIFSPFSLFAKDYEQALRPHPDTVDWSKLLLAKLFLLQLLNNHKNQDSNPVNIDCLAPTSKELSELYQQAGWKNHASLEALQHSIYASSCWFQVNIKEKLAGVVRLQSDYVRYCCIYDLLVDKDHRSKGVGSALMEAAVQWCDQRQIQIVHLWPATGRIPFFERFGFQSLSDKHPMMIRSSSYTID